MAQAGAPPGALGKAADASLLPLPAQEGAQAVQEATKRTRLAAANGPAAARRSGRQDALGSEGTDAATAQPSERRHTRSTSSAGAAAAAGGQRAGGQTAGRAARQRSAPAGGTGTSTSRRHDPASAAAGGGAAAHSPSPAPPAAAAGVVGRRHTRRSSSEHQEMQGSPPAEVAAAGGDKGGGKGSKRLSRERQPRQGSASSAAAAAHVAGGGSGGATGGNKRSGRPQHLERGEAAAVPADAARQHFPSGGSSPAKGWQQNTDGWWRRTLTHTACCGKSQRKLGFPADLFKELMGREAGDAEDLSVVDASTEKALIFHYRKDHAGGGSNIMGAALAHWLEDVGALAGDFIALRRHGDQLELRHIPAAPTAAGAGSRTAKRRRTSSREEGEAVEEASAGKKPPGRPPKGKQPAAPGIAAQGSPPAAAAAAASAAARGVESQLSGDALLQRRIEVLFDGVEWYAGLVVDVHHFRREVKYTVIYDDGENRCEPLQPGEWRLLEEEDPSAAAEQQAQQAAGKRQSRQAAGRRQQQRRQPFGKRQLQRRQAVGAPVAAGFKQQKQADEVAADEPPKKKQWRQRLAVQLAGEQQPQQAQQEAAPQQPQQEQQAPQQQQQQQQQAPSQQQQQEEAPPPPPPPQQQHDEAAPQQQQPQQEAAPQLQQQQETPSQPPPQQPQQDSSPQQEKQQREEAPTQQQPQQAGKPPPRRGKPAAKEAARLLESGLDVAALVQSGRGRRKAADAATAGVQAALHILEVGEAVLTDAPLLPEVPGAAPAAVPVAAAAVLPVAAPAAAPVAAATVALVAAAADAVQDAALGAAAAAAAPGAAVARRPSAQRRRASGAAKPRTAGAARVLLSAGGTTQPAADAAAAGAAGPANGPTAEPLPPCYWYEQRQPPFNENLPRDARKAEMRSRYEVDGLVITSCHDCQEACHRYPCQSGNSCHKTYCVRCMELYRYLLAFGPEEQEQYELRRRFAAGHCPCCLRICLRNKCRQKSLKQLGGEDPVPDDSTSRQIVLAYHMARRLLPAVEQIVALQQEEAWAAGTSLQAAQQAAIGYMGNQRAPHSERALCNHCATCLENLHFHCASCDQDICPLCAREARQGKAQAHVQCTACRTYMQPMRFLDDDQLDMLQRARQRLDAALGGGFSGGGSGGVSTAAQGVAAASPLPRLLWNLCKGSCGCQHERVEWFEPETDWVQQLQQAAAFTARFDVASAAAIGAASGECCGPAQREESWTQLVPRPASQQAGGEQRSWNAGDLVRMPLAQEEEEEQQQQEQSAALAAQLTQSAFKGVLGVLEWPLWQPQSQQPQLQLQLAQGTAAVAHGAAAQQQAQQNGFLKQLQANCLRLGEGLAGQGGEGRPKRQRQVSRKILDIAEDEEVELSGQLAHWQQAHLQVPAAATASTAVAAAAAAAAAVQQQQLPRKLSDPGLQDRQWWWHAEQLPDTDVRLASTRGTQDFIWTPHVEQFSRSHPRYDRTIWIFQKVLARGEPIILRGLRGSVGWTPEAMGRVCKESANAKLQVIDCSDFSTNLDLKPGEFFKRYKLCHGDKLDPSTQEPLPMLKLKDFPPTSDFKQVMARHNDDFLHLLNRCMPAYTHPTGGALNLACHLPWYTRLPDLGPKGYIAFGREEEHEGEGDSVTKLHEDLSDAINIMLHTQQRPGPPPGPPRCGYAAAQAPGYGGAGAVWDLVRREDRSALRRFLIDALAGKIEGCPPFVHKGRVLTPADVHDVVHDQCFMLTTRHRQLLQQQPYGVHVWHLEQYEHEAVWIPGGCAHQVRNLRSSIKVALDFVSPDAVAECLELRDEFRQGAKRELEMWQAENPGQQEEDVGSRHYADKLQIGNMVLHGFLNAMSVLDAVAAGRFDAIPRFPPPLEEPWTDPEEDEAAGGAGKPRRQAQRQQDGGKEDDEAEWDADEGGRGGWRGGSQRRR